MTTKLPRKWLKLSLYTIWRRKKGTEQGRDTNRQRFKAVTGKRFGTHIQNSKICCTGTCVQSCSIVTMLVTVMGRIVTSAPATSILSMNSLQRQETLLAGMWRRCSWSIDASPHHTAMFPHLLRTLPLWSSEDFAKHLLRKLWSCYVILRGDIGRITFSRRISWASSSVDVHSESAR